MINFLWSLAAKLLARPAIADWLIARAKLTPYQKSSGLLSQAFNRTVHELVPRIICRSMVSRCFLPHRP